MALTWCRPEDLNPQPTDYKSVALPIELGRLLKWWRMTDSNRRPSACKADALPAELILRFIMLGNVLLSRNVSPTTIGAKELNFCVRHGNRCDLFAIVTKHFFTS